jgi:DNA-binding response OmpR family regulator
MRPKKRILLIDTDEERQAIRRFLFVTHAFHVISASSADEARAMFATEAPELIVCAHPLANVDTTSLLSDLHQVNSFVPSMMLHAGSKVPTGFMADATVPQDISAVELLERVKVMAARKRGPRPKGPAIETLEQVFACGVGRIA